MDDFFARETAAKRVSGAVVAIARDDKLVHHKGTASSIRQKIRRFRSVPYSHSRP